MQDVTTVLVVDDEKLIRTFAVEALESADYNVLEASDADEALQKLERYEYVALVFTDIRMPGSMNGVEFARIVSERWPDIRVLLTSGADNRPADAPPMCEFLAKPYTFDDLLQRAAGSS